MEIYLKKKIILLNVDVFIFMFMNSNSFRRKNSVRSVKLEHLFI